VGVGVGSHPRLALLPLDEAESALLQQDEEQWRRSSLGVSLIAKMPKPSKLKVAAAAALVAQEVDEQIRSRFDLSVWDSGVLVSEKCIAEATATLDHCQAAARATAKRRREEALAAAAHIINLLEDKVQGELRYKEERRLWEEKQARLRAEAEFNARMAALKRRKELFCPSPRTARQREFTARYLFLRGEGEQAYDEGAFAVGLTAAKGKHEKLAREARINEAVRKMMNRPLVKVFNAWRVWANTNVGERAWGSLQTATLWKFDKKGQMARGTMELVAEAKAQHAAEEKVRLERKERRSIRGMAKRADAAITRLGSKVAAGGSKLVNLPAVRRTGLSWGAEEAV